MHCDVQELVVASELISYYDVSGCYILRPWAFAMWEVVHRWFDDNIKALGVQVWGAWCACICACVRACVCTRFVCGHGLTRACCEVVVASCKGQQPWP
jgi:hypothetical protein